MGPTPLHGWDAKEQNPDLTLLIYLATFVFSLILNSFSFMCFWPLLLLFFFIMSLTRDKFGFLSFYIKGFGPLWAK